MPVGLEKLLRCGKCQQQYDLSAKRPKLLVCHHCFCMQCIQSFIKTKSNQTASCPTCSKATCIGRNGVAALPDNEYLLPQLRAEAKAKKEQQTQQYLQQENIDPASDIFCSDSEEEEGYLDEAAGGGGDSTFFNGSIAAASGVSSGGEVRIFCQSCMTIANSGCLAQHQICNYDTGIKDLQDRLSAAVQKAGESLFNEVHLLEESSTLMGRVQAAWSLLGQVIDQTTISQTVALTSAKSLLDKLPDPKLGSQAARIGDPSTLVKAVIETENIMVNSSNRLRQTATTTNIWKAISNCNVNVQTVTSLPLNSDGTLFPIELNDRTKEDVICLMFALSKLLEARLKSPSSNSQNKENKIPNISNITKNTSSSSEYSTEWIQAKNGKPVDFTKPLNEENNYEVKPKRVPKSISNGCAYCFFDLMQGHAELGRIVMEVNCKAAPKMAKNFIELCTGQHGFGYLNTKLWRTSQGDHVDGGDIPEGGQCSIFDKKPFFGDSSPLQDGLGMLRMRGRGTSQDGQAIVGSQFMVWIKARKFKNYTRTLVFGKVSEGLELLTNMPETRQRKGKPFVAPVTIIKCGVLQ